MRRLYCMLSYAREDAGGVFSCILDLQKLKAFQGEKELELSMTEFRRLQYFLENKNHVLLKEQILRRIWDADGNFVEENTLSVNISRLRRKIGGTEIGRAHV